MTLFKYFHIEEFACPCCGRNLIKHDLVHKLDTARHYASIPFIITSGYRCEKHNREVGGIPDSAHLHGLAADILVTSSASRFKILSGLIKAGFQRIGIGPNFIHADIDFHKPYPVVWLYS